ADVYGLAAYYSVAPPKQAHEKFQTAVAKALQLNPNFSEAYSSKALGKLIFEWDFSGAERVFIHALDLNPNHVTGHSWYALCLTATGRLDEALEQMASALELDPLSLVINSIKGWIPYFARRYRDALDQLTTAIEMDPNFALARYYLGFVYIQLGQFNDAVVQF